MTTTQTSPRHALIVDDYQDTAHALAAMMESFGWKTDVATDGIDALKKAHAKHPELVFLDISMPKLDGFDTCGVIRAQPWSGGTRLIAVTGLPPEQIRERLDSAGFDACLIKPVGLAELSQIAGLATQ